MLPSRVGGVSKAMSMVFEGFCFKKKKKLDTVNVCLTRVWTMSMLTECRNRDTAI